MRRKDQYLLKFAEESGGDTSIFWSSEESTVVGYYRKSSQSYVGDIHPRYDCPAIGLEVDEERMAGPEDAQMIESDRDGDMPGIDN